MNRPWVVTVTVDVPVVAATAARAERIALDHVRDEIDNATVESVNDATRCGSCFGSGTLPYGTKDDEPFECLIERVRAADEHRAALERAPPRLFDD